MSEGHFQFSAQFLCNTVSDPPALHHATLNMPLRPRPPTRPFEPPPLPSLPECSELYLALAPSFSNREEAIPDIDELSFRKIITYMAIQWTAAMAGEVSRVNRVKALLLHMWKSLNTQEDAIGEAVNQGKRMDVTKCRGGDLNICGSSDFNATFLAMWQQDGYCDYLHLGDTSDKSARLMIKKLLRSPVSPNSLPEFTASMIGGTDSPGDDGDLRDGEGGDGADGRRGTGHSVQVAPFLGSSRRDVGERRGDFDRGFDQADRDQSQSQ